MPSKKVELTESGKFIEVERDAAELDAKVEKTEKGVASDVQKITPSPNQSPGKSVRIKENGAKENGAKTNGDTEPAKVFFCLFFALFRLNLKLILHF